MSIEVELIGMMFGFFVFILSIINIKFRYKFVVFLTSYLFIALFLFLIAVNRGEYDPNNFFNFIKEISKQMFLFFSFTIFVVFSGTQKAINKEKKIIGIDGKPEKFLWHFLPYIYFIFFLSLLFWIFRLLNFDTMLIIIIVSTIGMAVAASFVVIREYKGIKTIYFISSVLLLLISIILSIKLSIKL